LPKNPNRAVTGNLKRSIKNKKNSALDYTIWTLQSPVEYWYAQEFWTPYMPARSFIRKWIIDNKKNFEKDLVKFINLALKSL
jgi:hypothetical protein